MKLNPYIAGVVFALLFIPTYLWNHELFLLLNGWHSPFADQVMGVWSGFGDGMVVVLLVAMLMLFQLRLGLAALLALTLSGLITQIIKRSLEMPRPPAVFEDVHILGHHLYNYSFPSGHSTSCGVMALLALLLWRILWRDKHVAFAWSAFSLFMIAAYGRIYGGVHFPLDMLVGFSIGLLTMWCCYQWSQAWQVDVWLKSDWSWKLPGLFVLLTATILAFFYEVKPNTAQILAFLLPIIALMTLMQAWKKHLR
ncbi:MAG: phosphatase PAP2 family protein [Mariprofundaceae bacterium]|nr:phosphatase PAP2 family protein [Mariprofundaceae bacterium]